MPNWKQVIVGDAFRVPSRDFNYYRDSFLIWPFLLFTIAGLVNLFSGNHDHLLGFKFVGLSLLSILLARERIILVGGALGFCAVQSLLSLFFRHDWIGLVVAIPTGALFLLLIRWLKKGLQAKLQVAKDSKHHRSLGWAVISRIQHCRIPLD